MSGGTGGYSIDSNASTGHDFDSTFGDARIQVQAPIINFGGTVHPGSLENGGDERGLPPNPGYQTLEGSGYYAPYSSLSGAIPASYSPGMAPRIQPALWDTYNQQGATNISGVAIAAIVAIGIGAFIFLKRRG